MKNLTSKRFFGAGLRWMLALVAMLSLGVRAQAQKPAERIIVAYIAGWAGDETPNPFLMTHVNYAFGHVTEAADGMYVQRPEMLRKVMKMKEVNPKLKIVLSVGGWTSGHFSEMAASGKSRKAFAASCRKAVDEYGLDGIDIDWEYPTSSEAGISSSPDDTRNFTLLMRDLRRAIGKDKLLTIATIADGKYIDFPACMKYLDFVNIMAYDVANPPQHHTTLFRSRLSGRITVEEAVDAHLKAGVPAGKLLLGMPLYGRGDHSNKVLDKYMKTRWADGQYVEAWDEVGQVPYLTDRSGKLVWGFDNPASIAAKCQLIIDKGLLGGMYWETTEDNAQEDLMRTVYQSLIVDGKASVPARRVLVLGDASGVAGKVAQWLKSVAAGKNLEVAVNGELPMGQYHAVIDLEGNHEAWSPAKRAALEEYVDKAQGSYAVLGNDSASVRCGAWPWMAGLVRTLRVSPLPYAVVERAGDRAGVLWTNTEKKGRTLFVSPQADLDALARQHGEAILSWLLHD